MLKLNKLGFTLAETLIAMMIIGVVAVLIIPNFLNNINEKTLEKQKEVFSKKFQEGLSQMRVDDKLAENYATTQDFVKQMQKYFKITQICDKENLDNCFDKTFYARAYYKGELTASKDFVSANLRTTKDLNEKSSYDSDVIGLRLSDGTQMLITYNPNCTGIEAGDTTGSTTTCFSYVTDVNGNKGPNLYGKDVISNIALIHNWELSFEMGDVFYPSLNKTCEEIKAMGIKTNGKTIQNCSHNTTDRWANAVYQCAMKGKRLPTQAELQELAAKLYGEPVKIGTTTSLEVTNNNLFQAIKYSGTTTNLYYWSAQEYNGTSSFARVMYEFHTTSGTTNRNNNAYRAFCVE